MLKLFLHSVLIYMSLLLLMRIIGKRQLGELELSELVVTILISEVAAQPLVSENHRLLPVAIPVLTMLGLEYLLSVLSLRSVRLRAFLTGKPSLLIVRGRIDQREMRKNRITPDELTEAMREDGILDLNEVQYAILETNGKLNIISTPAQRPATAGQLGVDVPDPGYPIIVINNGRVLSDNLRVLGRDENWLRKRLSAAGYASPGEIYMMTADMSDGVFISPLET